MKDLALALREQFGRETEITPLIAEDRMGRRIHGVDLLRRYRPPRQSSWSACLINLRSSRSPVRTKRPFGWGDLERLANHFVHRFRIQKTTPTTLTLKGSESRCGCYLEMSKPLLGVIRLSQRPFSVGQMQIALRCTS